MYPNTPEALVSMIAGISLLMLVGGIILDFFERNPWHLVTIIGVDVLLVLIYVIRQLP